MDIIRGNVGQIKYVPAVGDKQQYAIVAVAEDKYNPPVTLPDGSKQWGEPDTVWHNDIFVSGEQAETFNTTFIKGDAVLIVGNYGETTVSTSADGRTFENRPFYAKSFGPDLTRATVEVVRRDPKVTAAADASQAADLAHLPGQDADTSAAEQVLRSRIEELISVGQLPPAKSQHIGHAWGTASTRKEAVALLRLELKDQSEAVREYLVSPIEEYAGVGKTKTWAESDPGWATPQSTPQTAVQEVAQIRNEVRQSL